MMLVMIVVGFVQSKLIETRAFHALSYTRQFSQSSVYQGEKINLVEQLTNDKWLPLPWVRIESKISEQLVFNTSKERAIEHGQYHCSLFSLMPFMKVTRTYTVTCKQRGDYQLNSAVITCGDLFFSKTNRQIAIKARLVVYPKKVSFSDLPMAFHSWYGDIMVKRWILPDPFVTAGIRPYQNTDIMRQINWKATARTNQLQVNQFAYTANPRLMIYLNIENGPEMWDAVTDPERVEYYLQITAALITECIHQGLEIGFGCNGHYKEEKRSPIRIDIQSGKQHLYTILEALARTIIGRSQTFCTFLDTDIEKQKTGIDYLLITPYCDGRMQAKIDILKRLGNQVTVIKMKRKASENEETVV